MTNFNKTLVAGLAAVTLCLPSAQPNAQPNTQPNTQPNVQVTQSAKLLSGKFLMCNTASQVAQYLTDVYADGNSGKEAQETAGRNSNGHKVCGIGHWVYELVGQHSKFSVGNGNYVINEIVVVGHVVNGIGTKNQPVKQFGFALISKKAKPVGFAV
jgi:hypothetical protein